MPPAAIVGSSRICSKADLARRRLIRRRWKFRVKPLFLAVPLNEGVLLLRARRGAPIQKPQKSPLAPFGTRFFSRQSPSEHGVPAAFFAPRVLRFWKKFSRRKTRRRNGRRWRQEAPLVEVLTDLSKSYGVRCGCRERALILPERGAGFSNCFWPSTNACASTAFSCECFEDAVGP